VKEEEQVTTKKDKNEKTEKAEKQQKGKKKVLKKKDEESDDEEDDEFEVEKIVDVEYKKGKKYYLLKWLGYPSSANSWESESNILSKSLIKNFNDEQRKKEIRTKQQDKEDQR